MRAYKPYFEHNKGEHPAIIQIDKYTSDTTFKKLTCHMKDRLESKTKPPNLERVFLLDAVLQHTDPCPVLLCKHCIVIRIQGFSLEKRWYELTMMFSPLKQFRNVFSSQKISLPILPLVIVGRTK